MLHQIVRIGIVGMGHVGPHAASCLIEQGCADEICVCDVKPDKLRAEVLDLYDATAFAPHAVRIRNCGDNYEKLAACAVIINAAGNVTLSGKSRDGELYATVETARSFVGRIAAAGFDGFWVDVSNPNDVVTREVHRLSGLPPSHVLGTGTLLDSARLKAALARATGLSPQSIDGYMLGEHGFTEIAAWSQVSFAGKPLSELARERPQTFGFDRARVEEEARMGGYYVYQGKQCTEYAIGAAAARLVGAIVHDEHVVVPASVHLDGQYGEQGFYISTLALIGAGGVEDVYELALDDTERQGFLASCRAVQNNYAKVMAAPAPAASAGSVARMAGRAAGERPQPQRPGPSSVERGARR